MRAWAHLRCFVPSHRAAWQPTVCVTLVNAWPNSLSLSLSQPFTRKGGRVNRGIPFHGVYLGKKGADTCDTNVIKFHSTSPPPPVYTICLPILVNAFSSKLYAYVELACTNFIAFTAFESMFERGIRLGKKKGTWLGYLVIFLYLIRDTRAI